MSRNFRAGRRRPAPLILGGLALLVVVIGVTAGVGYWLLKRPAGPAYAAQSACDHPYFPLRQGARWQYVGDVTIGEQRFPATASWLVERVHGDETRATAIVVAVYLYAGGEAQVTETVAYTCSDDGIVRDSLIAVSDSQRVSQYASQSGAYLPPATELAPDASWDYLYNIVTDYAPPGTDYTWFYEATGLETVNNGADTFEALRVQGTRSQPVGIDSSTEWFAVGVGQVRSERVQQEGQVDVLSAMTLIAYHLPSP